MNPLRIVLITMLAGAVVQAAPRAKYVEAGHAGIGPVWKDAKPDPKVKLDVGSRIYVSTNIYPDSFDGLFTIRPDGTILPRHCKRPVKIAGLNEEEASQAVLDHACSEGIYNPKSDVTISVIQADRFNKKGQAVDVNRPSPLNPSSKPPH